MTTIEEFARGFREEPGYLDYGRVGPLSATVRAEVTGQYEILSKARFGSDRADAARRTSGCVTRSAALTRFPADQVVFQPNASSGLMHALFGLTGGDVLLSLAEFPSLTYAAVRAAQALHVITPVWLETDHGRVTPGAASGSSSPTSTAAVAVSLVDSRTGYLADIDGIRQVIGDRLLIVDAIQGFGVVDAPYEVADVVVSGGQKWMRAGWGTGFLALSERAHRPPDAGVQRVDRVRAGAAVGRGASSRCTAPRRSRSRNPDLVAEARFAAALEEVAAVGVAAIAAADLRQRRTGARPGRRVRHPGRLVAQPPTSARGSSCSNRCRSS